MFTDIDNKPKVKRLQKLIAYSSKINNDDIRQKSIQMITNGKNTKVDLYSRKNNDIHKKTMKFENNKKNLEKLLKVNPVFEELDTRLYKDFFLLGEKIKKKRQANKRKTQKGKIKTQKNKMKKRKTHKRKI